MCADVLVCDAVGGVGDGVKIELGVFVMLMFGVYRALSASLWEM